MGKGFSLKQASLAGGIISPQALGRTDQNKYATGLRTCINAQITRYGTVENRAGTAYIGQTKDDQVLTPMRTQVRLVPFVSFLGTSYVLEFGYTNNDFRGSPNGYIRPWKNGSPISVVGAANWSNATGYVPGNVVLNTFDANYYYCYVANTNLRPDSNPAAWYLTGSGQLEIPFFAATSVTPLTSMQYVQQNDVLTIASQSFIPQQLLHYSDTNWVIKAVSISVSSAPTNVNAVAGTPASGIGIPTGLSVTGGFASGSTDAYRVAAFNGSLCGVACAENHFNFHQSSGGSAQTITWTAVGGATGYIVYKQQGSGAFGIVAVVENGTSYQDFGMTPASPVAQALSAPSGATLFTYVVTSVDSATGAESIASASGTCTGSTPSGGTPNVITWTGVSTASKYNVYSVVGGVPGYIGSTANTTFSDTNILPDTSKQPPVNSQTLLSTPSDYPAVVAYYQQRLCFANTANQPSTVWMSNVGAYTTFSVGVPAVDTQYVSFTLAGTQVQPIQAIVDLGKMIVHTSNGEYLVTGNAYGAITPSSVSVVNTGSAGSALIQPVVIGNTDLFVQQGSTRLCDLRYEVQRFTFAGKDLTKFSTDLFKGRTIVSMAYQKLPQSIVWCVLDNGTLLGLTYVGEDELYAWHVHTTSGGFFEQVAVVLEGSVWALYASVRRTIGGATVRYIERFASRDCTDTVLFSDSIFLDASLTFDGRNVGATTMTVTTAGGWTQSDTFTITASAGYFVSGDVGNRIVLQQKDATTGLVTAQVAFDIRAYTSSTVVTATAESAVPTWARVALTTWGKAVKTFSGISHLNGQAIGVLADGNVVADPLNAGYPTITVAAGAFTLTQPAMVVTAGLPIQTDVQTLPLENAQGESIQNKRITVREATPILYNSRGGSYGQDSAHLNYWKQPNPATGLPIAPYTGPVRLGIQGTPQVTGSVWMRHTEPTPWAVSAVIVTAEIGD